MKFTVNAHLMCILFHTLKLCHRKRANFIHKFRNAQVEESLLLHCFESSLQIPVSYDFCPIFYVPWHSYFLQISTAPDREYFDPLVKTEFSYDFHNSLSESKVEKATGHAHSLADTLGLSSRNLKLSGKIHWHLTLLRSYLAA